MILKLAFRNVFRNVRRSLITALTVCFGCFFLIIGLAWLKGIQAGLFESSIASTGAVRLTTQAYGAKERIFPTAENMPFTQSMLEKLRAHPSVSSAHELIRQAVAASQRDSDLGDLFCVLIGAEQTYYKDHLNLDSTVVEGSYFSNNSSFNQEVILGHRLAEQMDITIGEEAFFLGQTQDGSISPLNLTVVGITNASNPILDRQAYVSLKQARWMADIPQGSTEILLYTHTSAESLAKDLNSESSSLALLSEALDKDGNPTLVKAKAWSQREPIKSILPFSNAINLVLSCFIVFVAALGILNTMMMSILERTQEIGVLRAMGLYKRSICIILLLESTLIGIGGGFVGSTLGSGVALWLQFNGVYLGTALSKAPDTVSIHDTIYARWSPQLFALTLLLAIFMAVVGAIWPIVKGIQISPAQAMRSK